MTGVVNRRTPRVEPLQQEPEAPFNNETQAPKQSALKLAGQLSRKAEDNATSRVLRRNPPVGAGGLQVAGFRPQQHSLC
jgi:hypothetical protein